MAGNTNESGVGRSSEGTSSVEALAEWRSSEQVENGISSSSPPYWDSDDDEDHGPKPLDMYGKYTWKIGKFSQIKKRELRSNTFEVGNYKWYILVYPQGCDVCNHLSLFLCVANHDKLLPGWSQFAQFTIAVVNKDPKKSKYSDTLHRFWKKEHDWGWKKFMEQSKVLDGFVIADTLIIKAQVQLIRERLDRPFRCLTSHYRRELLRVYLTATEQICRRFADEKRIKLGKLVEDKSRWSSFRAFWIAMDQSARRHLCSEKTDAILRVIIKQFFIEKEVTSTLIMDSLYSGLRVLEGQSKCEVGSKKLLNAEEFPIPIVHVEKDAFILVADVLKLLETAAMEPLPPKNNKGVQIRMKVSYEDDKGVENRVQDGCLDDSSKDSVAHDEKRLTELGRRTIELFVVTQIFSKIEVAYKETIALKRQEELIREEEVWLAETEQKAKRGVSEKEKKLKKKQTKQKRTNRKGKDKGQTDKPTAAVEDDRQLDNLSDNEKELMVALAECMIDKLNQPEDVPNVYDSVPCQPEIPSHDSEERETSLASWDTDAFGTHPPTDASSIDVSGHLGLQSGTREKFTSSLDSMSTYSRDLIPSLVMNDTYSEYSLPKTKSRKSLNRVKNYQGTTSDGAGYYNDVHSRRSGTRSGPSKLIGAGGRVMAESESKAAALSVKGRKKEGLQMEKKEKVVSLQWKPSIKSQAIEEIPSKEKPTVVLPSPGTRMKPVSKFSGHTNQVIIKKPSSDFSCQAERKSSIINTVNSTGAVKLEAHKVVPEKPTDRPLVCPLPVISKPFSAPIVPGPKLATPVSHVQTLPQLSRSVSTAGCLVPDASPSYPPQSYRNAIMGITQSHSSSSSLIPSQSHTQMSHSPCSAREPSQLHIEVSQSPTSSVNPLQLHTQVSHPPSSSLYPSELHSQGSHSPSSLFNTSQSHTQVSHSPTYPLDPLHLQTQMPNLILAPKSSPLSPEGLEPVSSKSSIPFGVANQNLMTYEPHLGENPQRENTDNPDLVNTLQARSQGRLSHSGLGEEFPYLDVINRILDDEQGFKMGSLQSQGSGAPQLCPDITFPLNNSNGSPDLGAAYISSCRFERDYYDYGYQLGYESLTGHFGPLNFGDMIPQTNPGLYLYEPIDGSIPSHWQMNGADVSFYGMMNADVDSHPYNFLENTNLVCSVMDYTAFGPSNAH